MKKVIEERRMPKKSVWGNSQWAVTSYGIERLRDRYVVPWDQIARLRDREKGIAEWPLHIAETRPNSFETFLEAFAKALEVFDPAGREAIDWDATTIAARKIRQASNDG
jgi:hypothetical protein